MSATSKWSKDLSQPHASLLVTLASSWEQTHIINRLLRSPKTASLTLAKPDLKRWLNYYTNHRLLTDENLEYFVSGLGESIDFSQFGSLYGKPDKFSTDSATVLLDQIQAVDANQLPDTGDHALPLSMAFMVLVWMPSLALYGDYPPVLLRKARHGNLETICALIKLDRSIIFDAGISKIIHAWTLDFQEVKLQRIGDAFRKGIPHISKKRIKLAWAQYVYDSAKSYGMPLTAPKVRDLFDALFQDAGAGTHDPDLAEMTDDAFYQAIAKRKKPLSNILKYRQA